MLFWVIVGLGAILDTILNSYDPPGIGKTTWGYLVTGLTAMILLVGGPHRRGQGQLRGKLAEYGKARVETPSARWALY